MSIKDINNINKLDKDNFESKAKRAMEMIDNATQNTDNLCGHGISYNNDCKACDELMESNSVRKKLKAIYSKLVALEFVVQPENRKYCLELRIDIDNLSKILGMDESND